MEHLFTNALVNEKSLYLRQHAHNPVQWHPWGDAALQAAKDQDKPILVSIGYAACHWCHVMERESFENESVAAYMNSHFINIKIDREERPDLDHIYMDAVQTIAGSGGWPLNVFLTTDAKPFYGGTYFPPVKAFNRPSWIEVLHFINDAWMNRREEVERQAEELTGHLRKSNQALFGAKVQPVMQTGEDEGKKLCIDMAATVLRQADKTHGGFGVAPKFPQTFSIQYLLAQGHLLQNTEATGHALHSLRQLLNGGIYDQLGGGLTRYSTDEKWLVPHFEKMLYDNALLVLVLCDAYQITKDRAFKRGIEGILNFCIKELKDKLGGYYSAIDADSEGVEGKFYTWSYSDINEILEEDSGVFGDWFGVVKQGNWEGVNILHIGQDREAFMEKHGLNEAELEEKINSGIQKLLAVRNKRVRPATDDKIILGWNALLLSAFCKAAGTLQQEDFKKEAIDLYHFLQNNLVAGGDHPKHNFYDRAGQQMAFVDDLAWWIEALIQLQVLTGDHEYISQATKWMDYCIDNYSDEKGTLFYYTHAQQSDNIIRKIEIYDGATPSGNSSLAWSLVVLSIYTDRPQWRQRAGTMLSVIQPVMTRHPNSFGRWAVLALGLWKGFNTVAIIGNNSQLLLNELVQEYHPFVVIETSTLVRESPLLNHKNPGEKTEAWVCHESVCYAPVDNMLDIQKLLKS